MKNTILWVFLLLFAMLEQAYSTRIILRHTYFDDGQISETKEIAVDRDTTLAWEYFNSAIPSLRLLPNHLIDKRYKQQSITVWADSTRDLAIETNWSNTYRYDSLSRLTSYIRGSCLICNWQIYQLSLAYDQLNRPTSIVKSFRFVQDAPSHSADDGERYEFVYDDKGNIVRMQLYKSDILTEQIDMLF